MAADVWRQHRARRRSTVDDDGAFTSFAIAADAHTRSFPTLRRHRLAVGLYDLTDGRPGAPYQRVEIDVAGDETEVPSSSASAQPDLVLLNDGDLTYAKVRLDERSLATLVGTSTRSTTRSPGRCAGAPPGT